MFFNISKNLDKILDPYYKFHDYTVYLDKGWHRRTRNNCVEFVKGYASDFETLDIPTNKRYSGNYCILSFSTKHFRIITDDTRGFPIYIHENITNLIPNGKSIFWHQSVGFIDEVKILKNKFNNFEEKFSTFTQIKDKVCDLFEKEIANFIKYNGTFTIPNTNGLDTLMLSAISGIKTQQTDKHYSDLRELASQFYYAYRNIQSDSLAGTGYFGDSYMLRMQDNMSRYFNNLKIDISNAQGYMEPRSIKTSECITKDQLLHRIYGETGAWHINDTITFTPFKHRNLPEIIVQLPIDILLSQATDGYLQKEIIKEYAPSLIKELDKKKNTRTDCM